MRTAIYERQYARDVPRRDALRYNPRVTLRARTIRVLGVLAGGLAIVLGAAVANADSSRAPADTAAMLNDLGFSLQGTAPDKTFFSFTRRGLLVPTPWGDFEATIVSTPVDRMVRVPLTPTETGEPARFQPYFTAGSRKNVDSDTVLEQARPAAFGDSGRTSFKAGAGVLFKLDDNVELFGEYQFMRLNREADNRGIVGPLGTTLDTSGFSLGLSVRY